LHSVKRAQEIIKHLKYEFGQEMGLANGSDQPNETEINNKK